MRCSVLPDLVKLVNVFKRVCVSTYVFLGGSQFTIQFQFQFQFQFQLRRRAEVLKRFSRPRIECRCIEN